ncbi:aminotransferase class I/II-fold pyridoxal phosphate-dependent enzyme [Patescibacteria group bacterium]|nr:aminotransferase class I/II-fold pyridoxal phosphate-dependent enzyme [Patescibacteria group bacterium]
MYSKRVAKIKVSPIKQIELLASKIPGVVSLAQGIPSFDTPANIKNNVKAALDKGLTPKYTVPPGLPLLREVIERKLAEEGMKYDFETEIIVTCGAIEALTSTFLSVLDEGDEVILPSPSYTTYQEVIKLASGTPVFTWLNEESGWQFDLEDFRQKISKKTKAVLICNPNNPTGTILSKEQLLTIADLSVEHNFFIILDEVYKDFIYNDIEFFSLATQSKYRKNIIRVFSLSKSYAMTGWRIAFLHSDKQNTAEILKVHDSLVTCAPTVSQYGAITALEEGSDSIKQFQVIYQKRLNLICKELDKLKNIFSYQRPSSAYFVFPKVLMEEGIDSWQFCVEILEKAKVALVPGIAFGPSGEGHIRMSFGRDEATIKEAFIRLKKYFNT